MKVKKTVGLKCEKRCSFNDGLGTTLYKIKSTMCNCGAKTIKELQENGRLCLVSSVSISEGGAHDVILKNNSNY